MVPASPGPCASAPGSPALTPPANELVAYRSTSLSADSDSTSAEAQLSALRSLGLTANFATNGDRAALEQQINMGRPVAVGWLHHGSVSAPSGGGHWSVVIGFTEAVAIHNDPNGEADLVAGGYTANTNGAGQHYSWKNWQPRWEADGNSTGWLLTCHP